MGVDDIHREKQKAFSVGSASSEGIFLLTLAHQTGLVAECPFGMTHYVAVAWESYFGATGSTRGSFTADTSLAHGGNTSCQPACKDKPSLPA